MVAIIVGLLIVGFIICICTMVYINKKIKKSAEELCKQASDLVTDVGNMEHDLIDLRYQIRELSSALYENEDDLK